MRLATLILALALGGAAAFAESSAGDAALFDRLDADKDGRLTSQELRSDHVRLFARLLRRADDDNDNRLTRDEFLAGLVPSRPEKPIEEKLPSTFPQADAVRWLLLTLDANGDSRIEADEVPDDMRPVFEAMRNRIDANKNGSLERNELSRGAPRMAQIAARYVRQNGIDVAKELKKLERKRPAANRFEQQRLSLEDLADPAQARGIFARLDGNGDGYIVPREVPEQLRRPIRRVMRTADRDADGRLSQREFLAAVKQLAGRQARQDAMRTRPVKATPERKAKPALEVTPRE